MMHLAVTEELIKRYGPGGADRLRFGTVLPDAVTDRREYSLSHFRIKTGGGGRAYDLTAFRNRFGDLMKTDGLYLGYYLHLIQDLVYRHFVYDEYRWDPVPEGNVERLHGDYRQANAYVIRRYGLTADIRVPDAFENEPLNGVAAFDIPALIRELKRDTEPAEPRERFFFTDSMADEYIRRAAEQCGRELDALKNGADSVNKRSETYEYFAGL